MVRISITAKAFDAIAATPPPDSVNYEPEGDGKRERHIWLERSIVNKPRYVRGRGESYSDMILRLAAGAH